MSKKRTARVIDGPFIPVLKEIWNCPAWRALSPVARLVYIAIRGHCANDASDNGRVYLSARTAGKELGLSKSHADRAFRELVYYGFLVQTRGGYLGVDGKGKAALWRLPELPCQDEAPTKDYLKWDGVLYEKRKQPNRLHTIKIPSRGRDTSVPVQGTHCPNAGDTLHGSGPIECPNAGDISRSSSTSTLESASSAGCAEHEPAPEHAPIGHNRGPALNGSGLVPDDDLTIPQFLRRTVQ